MRANHSRVLWAVLVIDAAMFLVEGVAGLLANALDMPGDALEYRFSLLVQARSARNQASVIRPC